MSTGFGELTVDEGQLVFREHGHPFMAIGFGELKVFSGSAHPDLAREIAGVLGVTVGQARLRRFPDSEVSFQIDENIRGTDTRSGRWSRPTPAARSARAPTPSGWKPSSRSSTSGAPTMVRPR